MENVYVHASAIVDSGAQIGEGTKIWHFAHVSSSAVIGRQCRLGQNVYIDEHVSIGDHVTIQNNVSVYEGVTIQENVFCGANVVFANVAIPRMISTHHRSTSHKNTIVERGASIGANATITSGVRIGTWAFVAAGAVINRDIPAYSIYAGMPARQISWICQCGITLEFVSGKGICRECGREYQLDQDRVVNIE